MNAVILRTVFAGAVSLDGARSCGADGGSAERPLSG